MSLLTGNGADRTALTPSRISMNTGQYPALLAHHIPWKKTPTKRHPINHQ